MASQVFVSPGVFTTETDLSFVTSNVGVTTLGLVGETLKGPAFEAIAITSQSDFRARFGGQSNKKFSSGIPKYELPYIALNYLSESNQLYVVRALGLSGYEAGNAWAIKISAGLNPATWVSGSNQTTQTQANNITYTGTVSFTGSVWTVRAMNGSYTDNFLQSAITSNFTTITATNSGTTQSLTTGQTIVKITGGTLFSAATVTFVASSTAQATGQSLSGSGTFTASTWSGISITAYENMVVAMLRSRATYSTDTLVQSTSGISISNEASNNPFATFTLSASSTASTVGYRVSLNEDNQDYITKVLGYQAKDKDTKLWVEEVYPQMLKKLNNAGFVWGLRAEANLNNVNNVLTAITDYKVQYQTPATPYLVSEVRGTEINRLFRFVSVSDGDAANAEIKISIININLDTKEFDIIVRDFNDTDSNPIVLESYTRCSMDPTLTNYVGKRVGTSDGDYTLKSKYIQIEFDSNAPTDAVPAGFEGYSIKTYGTATTPTIFYKTSYVSGASGTDVVKKTYLGISELAYNLTSSTSITLGVGLDQNHFNYLGNYTWTGKTSGFHLDSGATINSGFTAGNVGIAEFRTEAATVGTTYEKMINRKFTVVPAGGFDGWDVYRTSRTNGDNYRQGKTNFVNAGFTAARLSDYYAYRNAVLKFQNPTETNINVLATPGIDYVNQNALVKEVIDMVEDDRADSLYIVTTPDATDSTTLADDLVNQLDSADLDTNYTATYAPWIQWKDNDNGVNIYLPPTIEAVRNIALTDNISFPWFAPAGLTRGLTRAVKARRKLTQDDSDTLYLGRINPIRTFPDVGPVIFGQKTLQVKESALDRINVRRLLLQARKLISNVAIRLVFEQNDKQLRDQFLTLVDPILDTIKQQRGLTEFKIIMDETNNTPETIDRNELHGKIFIKPTKAAEFIYLDFVVTNTGASFSNI